MAADVSNKHNVICTALMFSDPFSNYRIGLLDLISTCFMTTFHWNTMGEIFLQLSRDFICGKQICVCLTGLK